MNSTVVLRPDASIQDLGKYIQIASTKGRIQLEKTSWNLFSVPALYSLKISENDLPYFDINPTSKSVPLEFDITTISEEKNYLLSRFAYIRRENNKILCECSKSFYYFTVLSEKINTLFFYLSEPRKIEELEKLTSLSKTSLIFILAVFSSLDFLDIHDQEEVDSQFAFWEFHDLLFHAKSRFGRHANGRIQPYRYKDHFQPAPLIKPVKNAVPLPSASTELPQIDFIDILEVRRSERSFSTDTLSSQILSDFLSLSARIKNFREDKTGGISFRPSPSAGALHGIEIYLVLNSCPDFDKGIYHYNPLEHAIALISNKKEDIELLLDNAKRLGASSSPPQVYCIFTARFKRYQYKYGSLAYSVMLKDLGCLHQTMSLTATYLNLSSVILGDTPTEPFQSIAQLNYFEESVIGSFSLGINKNNTNISKC